MMGIAHGMATGIGVLVATMSFLPARALASRTVLLESHSTEPSAQIRRMLRVVTATLGDRVVSGKELASKLEGYFGRESLPLPPAEHARLLALLKTASQHVHAGEWKQATVLLSEITGRLGKDILSVSQKVHLFEALQEARILLCICHQRMQEASQAWTVMEDILRSQPRANISTVLYGPMLQRLFYQVHSQLELGKGTLRVTSSPPGALIFLSGRGAGFTPVDIQDLYQGSYDVLLLREGRPSRIKKVTLGYQKSHVHFDLEGEQAIRTSPVPGFFLPESSDRDIREWRLARQATSMAGGSRAILLGLRRVRGGGAIFGQTLDVSRPTRVAVAYVPMDPPEVSEETLVHLARFLLHGGAPGQGVIVARGIGPSHPATQHDVHRPQSLARRPGSGASSDHPGQQPRPRPTGLGVSGWLLLSVGLATSLGGITALSLDGRTSSETDDQAREHRTGRLGGGLLGGGLGLAAAGAGLLVWDALTRRRHQESASRDLPAIPYLSPMQSGAMVGMSGRF